jgi:Ca2+-binding RTX toxin-like protein
MKRFFLGGVLAIAVSAAFAAPASAAPTCSYVATGNGVFSVAFDATALSAKVTITRSGNDIQAFDANGALMTCIGAQATIANTEEIEVIVDPVGHNATLVINEQNGAFAPGTNVPPDPGSPEIDFAIDLGDGSDQLQVDGTDQADNFLLGENGMGVLAANLNGPETTSPDADLVAAGIESAVFNGRKGDDDISAVGNTAVPAIANPLTLAPGALDLEGGNQNDHLRGGAGDDKLGGGTQDDDIDGGGGNDAESGDDDSDSFEAEAGSDSMDGGTGLDTMTYAARTNAVNVTLDGAANDGGVEDGGADNVQPTIENVKGGAGADNIVGSILDNDLTGNAGNDTVDGSSGNDKVSGSDGDDRLLGNVGNDRIFGGNGRDNQVGAGGNDTITGNAGVDIFLGKKGLDRLLAKANDKDKKIDCGPGANKHESFTRDSKKDPKPKSC